MKNINNINPTEKSIGERKIKMSTYKRGIKFFSGITALATILTMCIIMTIAKQVKKNNAQDIADKSITSMLGKEQYGDIISMYTYRVNNNQDIAYDLNSMAKAIVKLEPSYLDIVLYSAYKNMNYKSNNLDNLFIAIYWELENVKETNPEVYYKLKGVKSFEDYLIKLNFVDKDGKISTKAYETYGDGLNNAYTNVIEEKSEKKMG